MHMYDYFIKQAIPPSIQPFSQPADCLPHHDGGDGEAARMVVVVVQRNLYIKFPLCSYSSSSSSSQSLLNKYIIIIFIIFWWNSVYGFLFYGKPTLIK